LQSIDREITRLELLVDDLLDTLRDRAAVPSEPVNVAAVVGRVADRMRATSRGMHVDVVGDSPVVLGHGPSIERAATAALHNAATHGGGGQIDVRVVTDTPWVRIDVVDDPGFGTEALNHATERFWRADSARSRGAVVSLILPSS